jgi:hypothetical protein
VAARDLAAGETVAVFEGPILRFADIPAEELRHVLWLDGDRWMIPRPPARWINHGCEPNCDVLDRPGDPTRFDVVTRRAVRAGEELTFAYNRVGTAEELLSVWHPAWTFECQCGAPTCRGRIDGYELTPQAERPDPRHG